MMLTMQALILAVVAVVSPSVEVQLAPLPRIFRRDHAGLVTSPYTAHVYNDAADMIVAAPHSSCTMMLTKTNIWQ